MPNDVLDLNLGQVQAVIDGYSERLIDENIQAVWTGYYASYYFSKHPKQPTEIIKRITENAHKQRDTSRGNKTNDVDMSAEIELFAQRDLKRLMQKGGNS